MLQVRGLCAEIEGRAIRDISFELPAGEILGVAGVSGNGQFTMAEALAGLIPVSGGDVILSGTSIASHGPARGIADNVAYIPERPIDNAVVASLDLATNLILREARGLPFFPVAGRSSSTRSDLIARYDVRPPHPSLPAFALSGGNLQKLVIAREMSGKPGLVIACYPTMGLDVLAAQAVYRELFRHAAEGACVVWISEELDDLMSYAHRIAVIRDGKIAGFARRDEADRRMLGRWMAGDAAEAA